MSCIVVVDMREMNGQIVFILDEKDNVKQFDNWEQASEEMSRHPLGSIFPVKIIDMDE